MSTTTRRITRAIRDRVPGFIKVAYRKIHPVNAGEFFSAIYRDDSWRGGSGPGSTPKNTELYRKCLEAFIRENNVSSVVDVGCGDWQSSHLIDWGGAKYIGLDVVPSVIAENKRKYGSRFEFRLTDASAGSLPPADLLLVKDVLQHWPNRKVLELLPKLKSYRYAIITNDVGIADNGPGVNADIGMSGYRPLDLRLPPFNLEAEELLTYRTDDANPDGRPNRLVLLLRSRT